MRIGISCHSTAGGSGILATELGIALAKRGHTIHFVTTEPPFRLRGFYRNIFSHTVNVVPYPLFRYPPFTLAISAKMFEVAKEHDIELWHVHYAIPYAACAVIAREMMPADKRFHIVTTLHGTDITLVGSDPSYFHLTKFAMERSCRITAVSNWLAKETQAAFELSKPIHTIYNFVNLDRFNAPLANRQSLAGDDEKIVMHISNFRPVKRVTDVVRTFKKILDRVNARLIMVGDGPERISAAGVARQLGVSDKITYLGNNEAVESILPLADLVFQPSEHESFGLVPLEAMLSGVPVLGTASGGVCEVVEHGVTGYLCEVGDTDAMARCALEVLQNEAKAREMGIKGRARARELFAEEKIVDQYERLYENCLIEDPESL
ncbi:MAG TPA: N-acetyl-alpha-D-glucosaminyl L-malate synthase BshA [Candidatus Hydrogenedentes bacterium]|nr:N-acetyl-alpha-D-glucosaminyl L-malate synthase BshA [Candidatus Hydrogenedentota bacterium]